MEALKTEIANVWDTVRERASGWGPVETLEAVADRIENPDFYDLQPDEQDDLIADVVFGTAGA